MVLALHRGGYETRQAGSGEEALSLLKRQSVDAVVLDVAMPGLSGIDVVKALRADPETATLPILIITGSGDHETVLQALEAGADDFVSKPVRLDELVARIRAHLRTGEAWSSQVEAELRGRADLVGVLGGLSLSADSDDAAAALVAELGRSAGCEFVGVLQMAEHGHLTVLATYDERAGSSEAARSPPIARSTSCRACGTGPGSRSSAHGCEMRAPLRSGRRTWSSPPGRRSSPGQGSSGSWSPDSPGSIP